MWLWHFLGMQLGSFPLAFRFRGFHPLPILQVYALNFVLHERTSKSQNYEDKLKECPSLLHSASYPPAHLWGDQLHRFLPSLGPQGPSDTDTCLVASPCCSQKVADHNRSFTFYFPTYQHLLEKHLIPSHKELSPISFFLFLTAALYSTVRIYWVCSASL